MDRIPCSTFAEILSFSTFSGSRIIVVIITLSYAQRARTGSSRGSGTIGVGHRFFSRSSCSLTISSDSCGSWRAIRCAPPRLTRGRGMRRLRGVTSGSSNNPFSGTDRLILIDSECGVFVGSVRPLRSAIQSFFVLKTGISNQRNKTR